MAHSRQPTDTANRHAGSGRAQKLFCQSMAKEIATAIDGDRTFLVASGE